MSEEWDDGLTGRERRFVLKYCTDDYCFLNGRLSYAEAYSKKLKTGETVRPSDEVADSHASRMLQKPKIRQAVNMLLGKTQDEADEENGHRLLKELVMLATYNPADILKADGSLKTESLEELGELAKCIEGIERTPLGVKYRLANRSKAQEKLLRYYGLTQKQALAVARNIAEAEDENDSWRWYAPTEEVNYGGN